MPYKSEQNVPLIYKYLRSHKKFPSIWCPGCGNGAVLGAIVRAVDRHGLAKDDVAMVSGIGCAGRMPVYVDFNTLHTTHGRALAFATGIKLAKPGMTVIVVMGDGDALAIGGNHFIHAARRNIDLKAIVVNNNIYGLTSGQASPTTPTGSITATSAYGFLEHSFDVAKLAEAAGASFVARSTVYHILEADRLIEKALQKKGFSVVEVISNCHVNFGKMNGMPTATQMLKWQRDNTISVEAAAGRTDLGGKIVRGVLVDRDLPEYTAEYARMVERVRQGTNSR